MEIRAIETHDQESSSSSLLPPPLGLVDIRARRISDWDRLCAARVVLALTNQDPYRCRHRSADKNKEEAAKIAQEMRNWGFRLWREPVGQDDDDDVDGNDTNTILVDYARTMFDIEHEESETTLVDLMERNPVESIPEASSTCGRLSFCVCVCVIFVRVMLVKLNLKIRFWRCFVTVNTTPIHIYPKYTLPRQLCCCEK